MGAGVKNRESEPGCVEFLRCGFYLGGCSNSVSCPCSRARCARQSDRPFLVAFTDREQVICSERPFLVAFTDREQVICRWYCSFCRGMHRHVSLSAIVHGGP